MGQWSVFVSVGKRPIQVATESQWRYQALRKYHDLGDLSASALVDSSKGKSRKYKQFSIDSIVSSLDHNNLDNLKQPTRSGTLYGQKYNVDTWPAHPFMGFPQFVAINFVAYNCLDCLWML